MDDEDSVTDTVGNGIVDMENITKDYMLLLGQEEGAAKNDPLINAKKRKSHVTKPSTEKSHLVTSIRQPYRSSHLGAVPAPKEELRRGDYQSARFVAKEDDPLGTTEHPEAMNDSFVLNEDNIKFKMFVNPVDGNSDILPSCRTTNRNLHTFGNKQEVEELAEHYSYFKNPRNYYEKLSEPMYYQTDARSRANEAKDLKLLLEDEKIDAMMSDMDSDESDDDSHIGDDKMKKIKDSMLSTELVLYAQMTKADQKAFLLKKRKENQRVMRQSKSAFQELAGFDMAEKGEGDDDDDDNNAAAERAAAAQKAKVTSRKVLGWGSVKKAVSVGITMKAITEMISSSSKKKRHGNNPPANMNMKEFTTFAKKLNKVIAENEISPEVETIIVDALHDRVDISIQGTKLGQARILVMEDTPPTAYTFPIASDFRNLDTLLFRYEGVVSITEEKITHTNKIFLTLKDLDPSTKYKIFVCAEHNDAALPCRNSDERIKDTVVRFQTEDIPDEDMEIEWGRLTNEQKSDELIAATFDLDTQIKCDKANIVLPAPDDVEAWLTVLEENSDEDDLTAEEEDEDGEKSPYGVVKLFLNWWTNNDPEFGHSSHRSDFLSREAKYSVRELSLIHECADDKFLTIEQSERMKKTVEDGGDVTLLPEYMVFRSWWKGGRLMEAAYLKLKKARRLEQFAELRQELLEREDVGLHHHDSKYVESDNEDDDASSVMNPNTATDGTDGEPVTVTATEEIVLSKDSADEDNDNGDLESPQKKESDDRDPESESPQQQGSGESQTLLQCQPRIKSANLAKVDVDDLIYVDDFDDEDPRLVRLQERSERLVELAQYVEDSITLVNGLLMAQRHADEEDLAIDDLERRRGLLRYEDVITIMAMKKLKELCEKKNVRIRDLDEGNIQKITGASTFVRVEEADLTPEEPPQATMLSLIGNAKRPMRNWANMSPPERVLEMQLACVLIDISELAVESGISVPNPEDGNILSHTLVIPLRIKRWANYEKWYIGNELSDNPKKQRPSLARIMFADWEKKSIKKDEGYHEILKKRLSSHSTKKLPTAESDEGGGTAGGGGTPPKLSRMNRRLSSKRMSSANLDTHKAATYKRSGSSSDNEEDEIVKTYESVINKDANIRCRYMTKLLEVILKSRNLGVLRLLLPPAWPGRMHSNFMFPRLGMITPCYTEPVQRFQPNPSFSIESYSVAEVMLWFSSNELDLDDKHMADAEVEGKKRQSYLEWLADEESRMLAGRIMMRREDFFSHHLRYHTKSIEVDTPKIEGDGGHKEFAHGPNLPGEYSNLEENDRYFEGKGCGIDNEDEVADILEQMRYEAESAIRAKKEMKKKMIEERKRKEEEEKKRLENVERDHRIEENKDRLVQLRKHLENLKESRILEKAAKEMEIRDAILMKEREEQEKLEEQERLKVVRMEQAKVDREIRQMTREDEVHHIQRDHLREFASMEHEDICGLLMREKQIKDETIRLEKIRDIQAVYEEFAPYVFNKSQIRVPHLHIDDEPEEDSRIILPEKIDWKMLKDNAAMRSNPKEDINEGNATDKEENKPKLDLNSVFSGNEMNDTILEQLLHADSSNTAKVSEIISLATEEHPLSDSSSAKYWPRAVNTPAMTTPLVWKGPDPKNDKSKQLRKKERPYTEFNASEAYLQRVLKVSDTNKVVFVETSTDNTLHAIGLGKEIIRTFGEKDDIMHLPPLNVKQPAGEQSHSHNMVNSKRATSPKTSFMDPVVFQPTIEGLSVDFPSSTKHVLSESKKTKALRVHVPARTINNVPNTYRVKTPKGKMQSKDGKKTIHLEKAALKDFIANTSRDALDPFYQEACTPGLRDSDSLSKKRQISKLMSKSMPEFKSVDAGGPMDSVKNKQQLEGDIGISISDTMDDCDSLPGNDILVADEEDSCSSTYNTARSENRIVLELQNSIFDSRSPLANIPMDTTEQQEQQDFDDDLPSVNSAMAMDDAEFRITDRDVSYEPNNRAQVGSSYQQYEEHHPPFYRKPFGVKGHVKPIAEESFIVRARKSADAITAQKEKEERIEQRKLMKKTKEEQKQHQNQLKKKAVHGTTVKSLHRDEFAALLRKSFEETSRQYDCRNVNFLNNKGL